MVEFDEILVLILLQRFWMVLMLALHTSQAAVWQQRSPGQAVLGAQQRMRGASISQAHDTWKQCCKVDDAALYCVAAERRPEHQATLQ